jgi:hypothetical protein
MPIKLHPLLVLLVGSILQCGAVAVLPATAPTTPPAPRTLSSRADQIAKLFCENPGGYAEIFDADFRAAVPDEKLTKLLKDLFASNGSCTSVKPIAPLRDDRGVFVFGFENGAIATVHLAISAAPPHLVSGFFMGPMEHPAKSFDDCISQLKKLPGMTSLYAAEIRYDQLKPLEQFNTDKPLALGSAFKLYVLAELVREVEAGERHWDDVLRLTEEAKSLPGGFLQKWPVGSPITIHTLASLMISQSDNTATDMMIRTLGREKIEAMLIAAGHSDPKLNQPFLTTVEMFKIKGDPARKMADEFLAGTVQQRREMLAGPVAAMPREKIDFPGIPTHINDVEWFATTPDLGRVMLWLKAHTEKSPTTEGRDILAINPGLDFSKHKWSYIGYKGGSEPGVLNMTYLLQSAGKDGRWFVVSLTWNNPVKALEESTFFPIVQQAVELSLQ